MDHLPPGPSAVGRRLAICVVAVGLLVGAVACSSDDKASGPTATVNNDPPPTTAAPATTTTTIQDLEAEIEAAYRAAEEQYYKISADGSSDLDLLASTRTGESLKAVTDGIGSTREAGLTIEYPNGFPAADVTSIDVTGERAVVRGCLIDDSVLRKADGSIVNDDVVTVTYDVDLTLEGDTWKVEKEMTIEKIDGRLPCPK